MADTQHNAEPPRRFGETERPYPAKELARFGPFVELRRIGEGGSGVVYTATNPRLPRREAVKVMARGLSDSQRAGFVQEVQNLAMFEIEGVARIYDAGEQDGWLYYSMELVDGVELDRYIREQGLAVKELLRLLVDVAQVVSRLHARGIVHRDLKPGNIMVTRDGAVRLLDFGIATSTALQPTHTGETTVPERAVQGTPDYMAPEQAMGEASVGPAADVYAFASMAYRLICGKHPLGETGKLHVRITGLLTRDPDPLSQHLPDVDPLLVACLDAALRKDPERRPSIDQLADELDRVITGAPAVSVQLVMADDCRDTAVTLVRMMNGMKAHFRRSAMIQVRLARREQEEAPDDGPLRNHQPDVLILVTGSQWSERQLRALSRLGQLDATARAGITVIACHRGEGPVPPLPALDHEGVQSLAWQQVADLEAGLRDRLEERVCELVPAARSSQNVTWEGCPYQGLAAFQPEDAPVFFGREAELRQVLGMFREAHARRRPLLLVMGPSGSGKSSFLRAGVLPHIDTVVDTDRRIRALTLGLGRAPSVWQAVASQLAELRLPDDSAALFTAEGLAERANWPAVRRLLARDRQVQPVLVVDQLEEVFSVRHVDDAPAFLRFLDALVDGGAIWVLGAIRNDFYPVLAAALGEVRQRLTTFDLGLPGAAAMADIIRQPAWVAGLQFGEDLETGRSVDELLLEEATRTPECLPLLEFTLAAMYDLRDRDHRRLTAAAYRQIGGVAGALRQRAEATLASLTPEDAAAFGAVFHQLVSCEDDGRAVRAYASWHSLTATPARRAFCRAFLEARLLVLNGDQTTVIHESLFRSWPALSAWIESNRQWLVTQRQVAEQHGRWRDSGRAPGLLLQPGPALDQAVAMREGLGEQLDPELDYFVGESVASARTARRLKQLAQVALVILTLVALGLLGVARDQNARRLVAQRQTSRQLAERYLEEGLVWCHERFRPDQGLVLFDRAIAARDPADAAGLAAGDDPDADARLARELWAEQVLQPTVVATFAEAVDDAWIAPDGQLAVATSQAEPGRFLVAHLATGQQEKWRLDSVTSAPTAVEFPAAGRLLIREADGAATLCQVDGRVIWRGRGVLADQPGGDWLYCRDGDDLRQIAVADGSPGAVYPLASGATAVHVSADGRTAIAVREDDTADVYDLAAPARPRAVIDPHCRMMTLGADRVVLAFDRQAGAADAFWWAHPASSRSLGADARLVVMDPAIAGPVLDTGAHVLPVRWQLTDEALVVIGSVVRPDPQQPTQLLDEKLVVIQRYSLADGKRQAIVLAGLDQPAGSSPARGLASPIELAPDGRSVLLKPAGDPARLWSLETPVRYGPAGELPAAVVDVPVDVSRVVFAGDSGHSATLSIDGACRVWQPGMQDLLGATSFRSEPLAMRLLAPPSGEPTLLTVQADGQVTTWATATAAATTVLQLAGPPTAFLATAGGGVLTLADGRCQVLAVARDGEPTLGSPLTVPGRVIDCPMDAAPWLLCYDADLQLHLVDLRDRSSRVIWDGRTRRLAGQPRFSADAQVVILPLVDQPLALYDIATQAVRTLPDLTGYRLLTTDAAATAAVLVDRSAAGPTADGRFRVLDLRTGSDLLAATPYLTPPALAPAGDRLAWGRVDRLAATNLPPADGPTERHWQYDPPVRLAYSADDRWLLSAHPIAHRLRVRDARTLAPVADLTGAADSRVQFQAGGDLAAVVDDRGQVRIWDIPRGQARLRSLDHERGLASLDFSPDGRLLATVDGARVLRLWQVGSGLPIAPPLRPVAPDRMAPTYHPASGSILIPGRAHELRVIRLPH